MSHGDEDETATVCSALDLECGSCLLAGARSVASLTPNMDLDAVRQIFGLMFSNSGCRRNSRLFEREYMKACVQPPLFQIPAA